MRIVTFSDTHHYHHLMHIPKGDVLIHAGDFSHSGSLQDVAEFNDYLGTLPHPHKIIIAGNHDWAFEKTPEEAQALITNATYLQDQSLTINHCKFYGSPWQPTFFNWAFNLTRGTEIKQKWDLIPNDTDILITHGPPYGYCDIVKQGDHVGCEELLIALQRIQPQYHIFGHIHEAYGQAQYQQTMCINASSCNQRYQASNPPVVFDI